jgi:hypothetical protein
MSETTVRLYALLLYIILSGIVGVLRGCGCDRCFVSVFGREVSVDRVCGFVVGVLWALALLSVMAIILGI